MLVDVPDEPFVPPDLRPAQKEALKAIGRFKAGPDQHGIIQMFCGTGKSRVMLECADFAAQGSVSVMVAPSIALITQFARDYVLKYGLIQRCKVVCICCENELPKDDPGRKSILYTTSK
jgi:superfamily II DNA or RNA helicase